jgi:DNA-binding phage protein
LADRRREILVKAKAMTGFHQAAGLRDAVAILVKVTETTGEELSVLSGNSLASCQLSLNADEDGRLSTLHRVLSALSARIRISAPGGAIIEVPLCAPGPCRPAANSPTQQSGLSDHPHPAGVLNRSRMDSGKILALYDKGLSIGEIARRAGISRQRVDRIAKVHGRPPRRVSRRIENIKEGRMALGMN